LKHNITSFLNKNKNNFYDLCLYLYNNPEISYSEYNSKEYICNLLSKFDFSITKNFLDIENSFIAIKGSGHPKICFLCEYDAIENEGHITGHNVITTISVAAASALGSVIDKCNATSVIIGCPGEYLGGSKEIMVKQGVFDDIDAVMAVHPDITTCESGSSSAIEPIGLLFEDERKLSFINNNSYTPLDAVLLTLNTLNSVKKSFPSELDITYVISNGGSTPLLIPEKSEIKFYIRAKTSKCLTYGDNLLRKIAKYVSDLTKIKNSFFLYEQPNKELITNRTLNRLFSHNLKENGVIHIDPPRDISAGLSIGDVSQVVPTIHPYISICDDPTIKYGSTDFANATVSEFAMSQTLIAAKSLAYTAMDLIKNDKLLKEVQNEFSSK